VRPSNLGQKRQCFCREFESYLELRREQSRRNSHPGASRNHQPDSAIVRSSASKTTRARRGLRKSLLGAWAERYMTTVLFGHDLRSGSSYNRFPRPIGRDKALSQTQF
jgi:hypothetical protein